MKATAAAETCNLPFNHGAPSKARIFPRIHAPSRSSRLANDAAIVGPGRAAGKRVALTCARPAKMQIRGRDNGHAQTAGSNLPFGTLCGGGAGAQGNPAGFGGNSRLALPPPRWHPMGVVKPGTKGGEARALRPQMPCRGTWRSAMWAGPASWATLCSPAATAPAAQQQPLLHVGQCIAPTPPAILRLRLQVDVVSSFAVLPCHGDAKEQDPLGCETQRMSPCLCARPKSTAAAARLRAVFAQGSVA